MKSKLTSLGQAHEDLLFLADRFKGLLEFSEALAQLGSLEKLTADAQERLNTVSRREAEIRSSLSLQAITDTNAEVAKLRADAKAEAQAIVA